MDEIEVYEIDANELVNVRLNPDKVIGAGNVLTEMRQHQLDALGEPNAFWNGTEVVIID